MRIDHSLCVEIITCVYVVGYFRRAASVSNSGGTLLRISEATASRISSSDLPPPDDVRDYDKNKEQKQHYIKGELQPKFPFYI